MSTEKNPARWYHPTAVCADGAGRETGSAVQHHKRTLLDAAATTKGEELVAGTSFSVLSHGIDNTVARRPQGNEVLGCVLDGSGRRVNIFVDALENHPRRDPVRGAVEGGTS